MTTAEDGSTRVRTSDAERESVAEILRNGVTEGRLTLEEGDTRLAALYATKYRDELGGLLRDLPAHDAWAQSLGSASAPAGAPSSAPSGNRGGQRTGWGQWSGGGQWPGGPGSGSDSTAPGASGPWGPGIDPRMWRRHRLFGAVRFALIAAFLITFFVVTGHFFWPIIPLLFLFNVIRFAGLRRRGGWCGPGR